MQDDNDPHAESITMKVPNADATLRQCVAEAQSEGFLRSIVAPQAFPDRHHPGAAVPKCHTSSETVLIVAHNGPGRSLAVHPHLRATKATI